MFQIGSAYLEINNDGYCATGSTMFGSVGSSQGTGYKSYNVESLESYSIY